MRIRKDSISSLMRALDALGTMDIALDAVGKNQQANVAARIMFTKMAPDGKAWEPWAPSTAKARARKGTAGNGILYDSGTLAQSITYQVVGRQAVISSNAGPYAAYLQNGTQNMPARPFLGWSAQDKKEGAEIMMEHIRKGIRK